MSLALLQRTLLALAGPQAFLSSSTEADASSVTFDATKYQVCLEFTCYHAYDQYIKGIERDETRFTNPNQIAATYVVEQTTDPYTVTVEIYIIHERCYHGDYDKHRTNQS